MATELEVENAEKRRNDLPKLEAARQKLEDMLTLSGESFDILIKCGDLTVSLSSLINSLETKDQPEVTALQTNMDAIIQTLIGADDVTSGTVRDELQDLIDNYDADIAAT